MTLVLPDSTIAARRLNQNWRCKRPGRGLRTAPSVATDFSIALLSIVVKDASRVLPPSASPGCLSCPDRIAQAVLPSHPSRCSRPPNLLRLATGLSLFHLINTENLEALAFPAVA